MIYYEQRALGEWGARVTYLNRPVPGQFVRAVQDVDAAHRDLSLRALWEIYSPDSPRNRPQGSAPAIPDPSPDPAGPAGAEEPLSGYEILGNPETDHVAVSEST